MQSALYKNAAEVVIKKWRAINRLPLRFILLNCLLLLWILFLFPACITRNPWTTLFLFDWDIGLLALAILFLVIGRYELSLTNRLLPFASLAAYNIPIFLGERYLIALAINSLLCLFILGLMFHKLILNRSQVIATSSGN